MGESAPAYTHHTVRITMTDGEVFEAQNKWTCPGESAQAARDRLAAHLAEQLRAAEHQQDPAAVMFFDVIDGSPIVLAFAEMRTVQIIEQPSGHITTVA